MLPASANLRAFSTLCQSVYFVNIPRSGGDAATGFYTDCVTMWMIAIPLAWLAALVWLLVRKNKYADQGAGLRAVAAAAK